MYEPIIQFGGLTWTHNPDGEYGEYTTKCNGHELTVYTNRDATQWHYYIDGEDSMRAEVDTMKGAMKEAITDAKNWS